MTAKPVASHDVLFDYPIKAEYGRVLPKNKVYAFGKPTRRVRDLITSRVARIVWAYKLAPDTINLPARSGVLEVQVFRVELKPDRSPDAFDGETLADASGGEDILRCIDKAIVSPIIYELVDGDRIRCAAAYKRSSEADSAKWVVGDYFGTGWLPTDTTRESLPVALDISSLYEQMLRRLMPLSPRSGESLRDQTERLGTLATKRRECHRIEAQLRRERQFNRKVELNATLRSLRTEVQELTE